jgi:hypothetical protein
LFTAIFPYRTSTFLFSHALIEAPDSIDSTLPVDSGQRPGTITTDGGVDWAARPFVLEAAAAG